MRNFQNELLPSPFFSKSIHLQNLCPDKRETDCSAYVVFVNALEYGTKSKRIPWCSPWCSSYTVVPALVLFDMVG